MKNVLKKSVFKVIRLKRNIVDNISIPFLNWGKGINKLFQKKECDYLFYRNNCPLVCVITGMEKSGTTLLSQLLNGHPRIKSGVECGILLSNIYDFDRVSPFYEWMGMEAEYDSWGWGVSVSDRSRLLTAQSYDEFYWILNRIKGLNHPNPIIREKFAAADLIFDKTPRYVYSLKRIMSKTSYKFLVTLKTPGEQYMSAKKYARDGDMDVDGFLRQYFMVYYDLLDALELFPDRIKIIPYRALVSDTAATMETVKNFIGIDDSIQLTLDQYNAEFGGLVQSKNSFQNSHIYYEDPNRYLNDEEIFKITDICKNVYDFNNLSLFNQ